MAKITVWGAFALCMLKAFGVLPLPWSIVLAPLWLPPTLLLLSAGLIVFSRAQAWMALHLLRLLAHFLQGTCDAGHALYRDVLEAFTPRQEIKHEAEN